MWRTTLSLPVRTYHSLCKCISSWSVSDVDLWIDWCLVGFFFFFFGHVRNKFYHILSRSTSCHSSSKSFKVHTVTWDIQRCLHPHTHRSVIGLRPSTTGNSWLWQTCQFIFSLIITNPLKLELERSDHPWCVSSQSCLWFVSIWS